MKHGTAYAKRVKRVYAQVKQQAKEPRVSGPTDPLEQLVLSVLSQETSRSNAQRAYGKLLSVMVDVNEVRVSSPREIADIIDPYIPHSHTCAARLCELLNAVFDAENTVNLDSLHLMGKRDAKHRLEALRGIEPYDVASVMLWSIGGHAVPVNAKLLAALRKEELVDPDTPVAEVQSFLERHVPPAEAKRFCLIMVDFTARKRARRPKAASTAKGSTKRSGAKKKTGKAKTARRKKAPRES